MLVEHLVFLDAKRLLELENNFLFAAYRALIEALKMNERYLVNESHLKDMFNAEKKLFVDIILRSARFGYLLKELFGVCILIKNN